MSKMHHWFVVSPEMSEVVPVLDDGTGPLEYFRDVEEVDAPTAREALRIGVPLLKSWFREARLDGRNPWAGVKATREQCPHLGCWCNFCQPGTDADIAANGGCAECNREHRATCEVPYCGCREWPEIGVEP